MAVKNDFPQPDEVLIIGLDGAPISQDSLIVLESTGRYFEDFYADNNGVVVKVIVRPKTEVDEKNIARINQILNEGPEIIPTDIDCGFIPTLLDSVYNVDQTMRGEGGSLDPEKDHDNLVIVVSILENCGKLDFSLLSEQQISGLWLVLQHGSPRYQKKYIPLLEEAAKEGFIPFRVIAIIKDRALMHDGEPQIYGTQIKNDALYDLFEPEHVDERRAGVDLGPLNEYLQRFGIDFEIPQSESK